MATTYDPTSDEGKVRLLLNDVSTPFIFNDAEIAAFLEMEGGSVKRAAAQAIDTNADNEALASKVLRTPQGLQIDGAKVAEALHSRAKLLREQAEVDDGGYFDIIDLGAACSPELTSRYW